MLAVVKRFRPAIAMGGGLLLVGAAGYVFVALAGHTLPPEDAAALASLYLLVNIAGSGVFTALEQETSRAVSAEAAADRGPGTVARQAWRLAGGLLLPLLVVLAAVSPVLTGQVFGGRWGLFFAVLVSAVAAAAVHVVRGLLGGRRQFTGYSATLAGEGLARIVPCLLVAWLAAPDATTFAVVFAAGQALGAVVGWWWLRPAPTEAPGAGTVDGMARSVSLLVGGTLLMLVVMNVGPVVVTARTDAAAAAAFASAFVLARIPLFLFAPVQAMLLPSLTTAATAGDLAAVRARLRMIVLAVLAIGLPGVVASCTVGPWAVQVLFGAEVRLSGLVVGLLGASTVGMMIALVLQPGLVAMGAHRSVTAAWLSGTVVLGVLLALPGDPIRAGVIAQLAGSALVVAVMVRAVAVSLTRAVNRSA